MATAFKAAGLVERPQTFTVLCADSGIDGKLSLRRADTLGETVSGSSTATSMVYEGVAPRGVVGD